MDKPDTTNIWQRNNKREVHLVIMRLLSELLLFNYKLIMMNNKLFVFDIYLKYI